MSRQGTTSEKSKVEENLARTSVLNGHDVSRETSSVEPGFKELYLGFRKNRLSRIESAYNAAYLYCNDKYYTSGAQLKERYRNIYAHPDTWFRHESLMWRHNKWSAAVKLLDLIPAAKRSADDITLATRPVKGKAKLLWKHLEYSHIGIRAIGKFISKIAVFVLCLFALTGVVYTIHNNTNKTPLLEVYVDGEYIGLSDSVKTVEQARSLLEETESLLLGISYTLDCSITYKPAFENTSNLMQPSELYDTFRNVSYKKMTEGYGLYVDEMLICASPYKAWLDKAIQDSLELKKKQLVDNGIDLDSVTYYNNMTVVYGMYPSDSFFEEDEIRAVFSLSNQNAGNGELTQQNLNVSNSIPLRNSADESGMYDVGYSSPATVGENKHEGIEATLNVLIEKNDVVKEEIAYNVVFEEDAQLVEGKTKVKNKGKVGYKNVTYTVGYLDNKEVMRLKLKEEVITLPVSETRIIGTRPMTEEEKRTMSTGTYIIPATGRYSSDYGWRILGGRHEFHKGFDIAGSYGSDILAADGGEVIHARSDNSGYGRSIQIRHDDETITRYAHCSKLYVKEGQRVAKGEVIGAMGSTGYSTGVHLHFEVIVNGKTQDPKNYIDVK